MLPREVKEKIIRIQGDGPKKLHVLSDFDRTLTKPVVNGKPVSSLISVLRDLKFLTPDYPEKAHALFNHYHPIEIDATLPKQVRKEKMEEWWRKHFELLVASGLTRIDITKAMSARHAELRDGAQEFFELLKTNGIPLVIMSSSGLGVESISDFLKHEQTLTSNVHIISNRFEWDKKGKVTGVHEPIIHGMNKDETLVASFSEIFQKIKNRPNVLLLGDSSDDLGMVEGFAYKNLLTVGFGEKTPGFDLQLGSDATLEQVNSLLHQILKM